jgi:hypothetical protein
MDNATTVISQQSFFIAFRSDNEEHTIVSNKALELTDLCTDPEERTGIAINIL